MSAQSSIVCLDVRFSRVSAHTNGFKLRESASVCNQDEDDDFFFFIKAGRDGEDRSITVERRPVFTPTQAQHQPEVMFRDARVRSQTPNTTRSQTKVGHLEKTRKLNMWRLFFLSLSVQQRHETINISWGTPGRQKDFTGNN